MISIWMRVVTADNKEIAASYPRLRSSAATCPITECSSLLPNLQRAEFLKMRMEGETEYIEKRLWQLYVRFAVQKFKD
jgi:hypothetical protein